MKIRHYIEVDNQRYFSDEICEGITVRSSVTDEEPNLKIRLEISNTSKKSTYINRCGFEICDINVEKDAVVFIDPGECAWGGVKKLAFLDKDPRMRVVEEQRANNATYESILFHRSDLQTVVYSGNKAVLIGFISQSQGMNKIDIYPSEDKNTVEKIEAWQSFEVMLEPGNSLYLDNLYIAESENPYTLLERFADSVREHHGKVFDAPPITGMMTWYGYHAAVTEDIVLENAEIISGFFNGYPQVTETYMLLDHGWQHEAEWGLLKHDYNRFPHGIKWLSDELKELGVKFGIWHTPFCISEFTGNLEEIKHMMLLDKNGCPEKGTASVWGTFKFKNRGGKRQLYYFDGADNKVQKRWENEMKQLSLWGADYCKMDFFVLKKGYTTGQNLTGGQLYKKSWDSFRSGFGSEGHIAPCSCDTNRQLGYCDSIRIASDIGEAGTWPGAEKGYKYGHSTIAAMWYKNRNFWVNDADSIQVAKGCSMGEARIRATTAAFSGGHIMLSEDLRKVNANKLDMVRRILPPMKIAARPLNLFENPFPEGYPSIWGLQSDWKYGPKRSIALFNFTLKNEVFTITPEMLDISEEMEYIVLEWWEGKWLGRYIGRMSVSVSSEDCVVLHAVPIGDEPGIVSVQHHISGGYILSDIDFCEETGELSGIIETKKGLKTILYGYTPDCWVISEIERAHVIKNNIGGWQMEIETTGQRTHFSITFEKRLSYDR